MQNFQFAFDQPLWFLLLIPALALTVVPYFMLSKKYRRTRNRIVSMILHTFIMVFAVSVLAGIMFTYTVPNKDNEIILLVDVSNSEESAKENRNEFIKTVLDDSRYDGYTVGVVTFGFDQRYAVQLTDDIDGIYDNYISAPSPDVSATNVAAALTYTKGLFQHPESGKIVLITDGKETDEKAEDVISSVLAQGIKVDTAYISSEAQGDIVQVSGMELPDYHVNINEECSIEVTIQSKQSQTKATIQLSDNGEINSEKDTQTVDLVKGTQTISFKHTFLTDGLHRLNLKISVDEKEEFQENNEYYSYFNLEIFNEILILERVDGESAALQKILTENKAYDVEVKKISSAKAEELTLDALRGYDQIILNNIANADMPEGFDEALYSYVYDYGGGLFTVGGNKLDSAGEPVANAYNREDMYGTLYQQMLPVQAINYTPPVGVIVIIDHSGSMAGDPLEYAKAGASTCVAGLSERDYFGVMTLDKDYNTVLPLTRRTEESKILAAIDGIENAEGGTFFNDAIVSAGQQLSALTVVDKKHIIIVTDGAVQESEKAVYEETIDKLYKNNGITLSIVGVNITQSSSFAKLMQSAAEIGHGRFLPTTNPQDITRLMREDLAAPEITEVIPKEFQPTIAKPSSPVVKGIEVGEGVEGLNKMTVALGGFYGTKARSDAELILVGDYNVPVYAQWKFGKGMVGSFMCDLNGTWSSDFMDDKNGKQFIYNVVNNLMPTQSIRPNDFEDGKITLTEENYINYLSITEKPDEGGSINGQIIRLLPDGKEEVVASLTENSAENSIGYVTSCLSASNNYSRCTFVIKQSGIYKIVVNKCDADGNVVSTTALYKRLSYSKEYDTFLEESSAELEAGLEQLAGKGGGSKIENLDDPIEIFDDFVTDFPKEFDPKPALIIAAIVLFLCDIAARKFKFKWIHELIREHKNKKSSK